MEDPPVKKGPAPELAEPAPENTPAGWLALVAAGALALAVLPFALDSWSGGLRKDGPPHWTDRYVRSAAALWRALLVAALAYVLWRESQRK